MSKRTLALVPILAIAMVSSAQAGSVFMDAEWAAAMCAEWNKTNELTTGLAGDDWIENDAGRGYKIIHIYRIRCGEQSTIELELVNQDGKAMCAYGGPVKHPDLNYDVDYLMYADDDDWTCMGEGSWGCGAMGAMMTGKLKFDGPKGEAMGVMGPFDAFLVGTGQVPADKDRCP